MRSHVSLLVGCCLGLLVAVAPCERADAQVRAPSTQATGTGLLRAAQELTSWAQQKGGQAGVVVVDAGTGRLLVALNESVPLNPASNMKLLTAAVALERLGPDYRYLTGVYGVLRGDRVGDLVLRGHGDPSLRTEHLWQLARALVARGLRRIEGRVLVDQSRFDDDPLPPGYAQRPDEWSSFRAPTSAVALDRNSVTLHVLPTRRGEPARVWFEPPGFVQTTGTVATGEPGSGERIELRLRPDGSRLRAEVGGSVAEGLGVARRVQRVQSPVLLAGYVLAELLRSLGVEGGSEVAEGGSEQRQLLVQHRSEPLGLLLREVGKNSDNFSAEMVFKTIGAESHQGIGSSARGAEVVTSWLQSLGPLEPGTVIRNGSGLYDTNRLSALALARVLLAAYRRPAIAPEFVAQLAVAGVDGTLSSRLRRYRHSRLVRAKTGSLAEVDALSGYVLSPEGGPPLVFSILVNGKLGDHREARRRIDRVVEEAAALWGG